MNQGMWGTTPYHAKYFSYDLTRRHALGSVDSISAALFDATVDLNPHQIDAALFALRSPLSKGVLLADEVGLGKTIEAGLVLCQYWAERRRKLLVICPASLRKQWSGELQEKFNLPTIVLDSVAYRQAVSEGNPTPFASDAVVITSFHFASLRKEDLRALSFDLVVIDEAHKLRNAYRPSNKMGQNIRWALEGRKKLLLTATPLQNSLLELYGLSTLIDETLFGDIVSFRAQYMNAGVDYKALRRRIEGFCKRTLRRQVTEYIQYTERRPMTFRFAPTDEEQELYNRISEYISRASIALPRQQRHLITLILRKLLASSSNAIAGTLTQLKERLEKVRERVIQDGEVSDVTWMDTDVIGTDFLDEILEDTWDEETAATEEATDIHDLDREIELLSELISMAENIPADAKSFALLKALEAGITQLEDMGANKKALIFTESRRTQQYLKEFLEANGYAGEIVLFSGTNSDPDSRKIINEWLEARRLEGGTGSRAVDSRTALIERFRDKASIMIATEAAAEGVNLQFCSLVINYDLPWNPQRVEQRIGRCHRYGQKHDVVVINFLNERNAADQRVYELLAEKFRLFDGVFGASDEVLGSIESGVDFERRIFEIYQQCRTPEEIEAAFQALRAEMEETIASRMEDTRRALMENFDEDVHARLKVHFDDAKVSLDRIGRMFWRLTHYVLGDYAFFDDEDLSFHLREAPHPGYRIGTYHLVSKRQTGTSPEFLYRLSHPLGEWVLNEGKNSPTPVAHVRFNVTEYPYRLSMVEALKGLCGWLILTQLEIESFDREEYLLFSGFTDAGIALDQEACERLFNCAGAVVGPVKAGEDVKRRLQGDAQRHIDATVARSLENNTNYFIEERERLDKWADDMLIAAEKELADVKAQIRAMRRQSRLAITMEEQARIQKDIRELERKQRKLRQQIFEVEDEIIERRDALIDALEQRMKQRVKAIPLFTIRWEVV